MNELEHFEVPDERRGVPTLVIGDTVLVGSLEIPEQFPGLIAQHLEQGGVTWPAIPGLLEALAEESAPTSTHASTLVPTATPAAAETTAQPSSTPKLTATPAPFVSGFEEDTWASEDWRARFQRDPVGNTISILVLLGMAFSMAYNLLALRSARPSALTLRHWQWVIPLIVCCCASVAPTRRAALSA